MTVSEWADQHRILAGVASAEAGRYYTDRTPYVREIADCLSATSDIHLVVFMKGAQLGGTEIGNNWIGYNVHKDPGPMLIVYPTVDVGRRISKQRLDPMIEATPELRERIREARSRDSGNTTFMKEFPGGMLIITGANSAAGLRSMPIRDLFLDEVDAYPGDVDGEGDPIELAMKRQATFYRRKAFLVSTPTVKGISRIEREFLKTDQRRYFVPCPDCGAFDWIRWENIRWEERQPRTARLACLACGSLIEERHKTELLARGQWRPTADCDDPHVRGFHLSALYSPLGWTSWAQCAEDFLAMKDDPSRFKTWWNTVKGETWEERGEGAEPDEILARAERYPAEVPNGVGILVASVDVQGDRLECQVKGFGAAEESWLIAFSQFHGDPGREAVWFELDQFLQRSFEHESGQTLKIECVAIDSGGHHAEQVYRFCKARTGRRIFAVRGGNERGKPVVGRPTSHNRYRTPLFTLCVDTAKEIVYARLRIHSPGPGYMHLPEWVEPEYVAQLTAEKGIRKYLKGRGAVRQWIKMRDRNEALDLEVYCLAALHMLGPSLIRSLPERATRALAAAATGGPQISSQARSWARPTPAFARGWVNHWKR